MLVWFKRYTSFTVDELDQFTPSELQFLAESLNEIISAENGPVD